MSGGAPLRPGRLYFAYGCNMERSTFAGVIGEEPGASWPAVLEGWRLAFNLVDEDGDVVANLERGPGCRTYGAVYRIPETALPALDEFEGVPAHYRRDSVWVEPLARRAIQAVLIYLGQPEATGEPGRPRAEYLDLILRGAREHGLPDPYLAWVRELAAATTEDCLRDGSQGWPTTPNDPPGDT